MSHYPSPEEIAARVAQVFERIHAEQMAGLPLLNDALQVAAVGFRMHESRVLGMVVTPWMMSAMLFPRADEGWQQLALGAKQSHEFPGGSYRFLTNDIDGLGVCQMHSVHSPMRAFRDQAGALLAAEAFLDKLLAPKPADAPPDDPVDEALLGRILRGEEVPELYTLAVSPDGKAIVAEECRPTAADFARPA